MYPTQPRQELQALIGRALVDPEFQEGLLNGERHECLAQFALTVDELKAAIAIEAEDLSSFAAQIDSWIARRKTRLGLLTAAAGV